MSALAQGAPAMRVPGPAVFIVHCMTLIEVTLIEATLIEVSIIIE
jgi:hypothetical protein